MLCISDQTSFQIMNIGYQKAEKIDIGTLLIEVSIKSSGKKLKKMDIRLADNTAVCRCVVWEKQIKMIEDGKSYKLGIVTVRTFNAAKFVSLGENSVVEEIEDIGNVIDNEDLESGVGRAKVVKAEIVEMLTLIKIVAVVVQFKNENCNV